MKRHTQGHALKGADVTHLSNDVHECFCMISNHQNGRNHGEPTAYQIHTPGSCVRRTAVTLDCWSDHTESPLGDFHS